MSDLDTITSKPKAKRLLKGVHFNFKGAHIAYTHEDQGGAASMLNEPVLLKSTDINKELTQAQLDIIAEIGEESTPLDKSLVVDNNTPSSPVVDLGEDNKKTKGNTKLMSEQDEILKKLELLEKANKVLKAEKTLAAYNFESDVSEGVANAIASLDEDNVKAITKAFDALIASKEEAVNKAKAEKVEKEENELSKALSKEEGNDSTIEDEVQLTMVEKMMKSKNEFLKKDAK